jgi:murein DD-endopeptidase MepM/ murein hydrolase activator NlpD
MNDITPNLPSVSPLLRLNQQLSGLEERIQNSQKPGSGRLQELKSATQQFEALFIGYLMKVMRSTVDQADPQSESYGKDIYTEMFDSEIANNVSQTQSLGIGDLLYRQLEQLESGAPAKSAISRKSTAAVEPSQFNIPAVDSIVPDIPETSEKPSASIGAIPITSGFGIRKDPLDGSMRFHNGIDMAAPAGTPFHAVDRGTVVFAGMLGTFGNTVVVDHPNGDRTLYAHASRVLVQAGQEVEPDQEIGTVGSTGRSTGPHLHFELRRNGESINPNEILDLRSPLSKNRS